MKHYVVLVDYSIDAVCEYGVDIIAVTHTLEEAKAVFANHINEEKENASGWEVYTDTDVDFDAGENGYYKDNHLRLYIQEVFE